MDQELEFDPIAGKLLNSPEGERLLGYEYRSGWKLQAPRIKRPRGSSPRGSSSIPSRRDDYFFAAPSFSSFASAFMRAALTLAGVTLPDTLSSTCSIESQMTIAGFRSTVHFRSVSLFFS